MTDSPTTEEILARPSDLDLIPGDHEIWDSLDHADHYDKEGRQITLRQWGKLHAVKEYIRVAENTIGPYWVSTVWIGLDHGFGAVPLIFESMVFKGTESDLDCVRYSTLEQALEGHAEMVSEVRLFADLHPPEEG